MFAHEVAVVGHGVGVLDVELYAGDVLHAYQVLCSVELNMALVLVLLVVLLHTAYFIFLFLKFFLLRLKIGQLILGILHVLLDGFEFVRTEGSEHFFLDKEVNCIFSTFDADALDIPDHISLLFFVIFSVLKRIL